MAPSPAPRFPRLVPAAVLAGTLAAAAATFTVQALNSQPPPPPPAPAISSLPPCASDDGSGPRPCVWLAPRRGNHIGRSFVILADGTLIYLDHAPACVSHELESGS
jgi:hypothetical protein